MRVLIGCEYSATVRDEFRKRGHDAWSCDLLPTEGNPAYHFQGDLWEVLELGWDLAIIHPPCTALAMSGNRHYAKGKPKHAERLKAFKWTVGLWEHTCKHATGAGMENPIGALSSWRKPSQVIQPWQFGHGETKATCLWLKNLNPLEPSNIVDGREQRIWKLPPSKDRWKIRSKTYPGIAAAMAEQWGSDWFLSL